MSKPTTPPRHPHTPELTRLEKYTLKSSNTRLREYSKYSPCRSSYMSTPKQESELSKPRQSLQRLLPRHFKILDFTLAGLGPTEIAAQLGITREGVSLICNSPMFQNELARRRKSHEGAIQKAEVERVSSAKDILVENAEKAARTQVAILDDENASNALNASQKILDRVFGKDEKGTGPGIQISTDQVKILQVALTESTDDE